MEYQDIEFKLLASLAALNVLQSGIIFAGLFGGLVLCIKVRMRLGLECSGVLVSSFKLLVSLAALNVLQSGLFGGLVLCVKVRLASTFQRA